MKKIIYAMLLFIVILSFAVSAEKGHMVLLTVGERGNETIGGTADVYLEVRQGSGRIFIDSFPLTKIDTQISARFAKEVACDFLEEDCSNKDFFYTIRADSSVVGGPSAGAALTVLTISVLQDKDLNNSVVMTGTINSGGIIGPVAGIEEKVTAAKKQGFKKVIVPKRSIISQLDENITKIENGTLKYADSFEMDGIDVVAVSTLEDALPQFMEGKYKDYSYDISVPEKYNNMMKTVSSDICGRYNEIIQLIPEDVKNKEFEKYNLSKSFRERGTLAFDEGDYYTSASFCFNANNYARSIEFSQYSDDEKRLIAISARQDIKDMLDEVDKKDLKTLSDLETAMVVKERLFEAQDLLYKNESEIFDQLAYIVERSYSAKAWSSFFDYDEKEIVLDESHLADACLAKISEAEERVNYLELLFGEHKEYREDIRATEKLYDEGDYSFCLFKATRIKADANAVISSLFITDEKISELIDDQLKLARIQINKQEDKFPIMGYSYYNYASSLKEARPDLSILFSEYASEFSNLDMYFPSEKKERFRINFEFTGVFLLGVAAGIFVVVLVLTIFVKLEKNKNLRKRTKVGRRK